ncbi:UPF0468 protein C16orf80-like, partial [Scleropages formosus]
ATRRAAGSFSRLRSETFVFVDSITSSRLHETSLIGAAEGKRDVRTLLCVAGETSGFLSILYSIGSKPLEIWDKKVRNGHIKRITDNDIQSLVLEVEGTNVSTTYITCPADPKKTLGIKLPFLVMIIKNLKKYFTFEVQIHANCRIRRVYFSDRLYSEDELPAEFKLGTEYFLSETLIPPGAGNVTYGRKARNVNKLEERKERKGEKGKNMFKNTFQSGFLSILYSIGSKPLQIWDKKVRNGHIKRITDNDIQSLVLEVEGTNVSTTYITCPADPKKTLGIKLPFLVMIIKNLKKYFTFEVQVLEDKNVSRRFRASNYQSTTRVKPFICTMPMRLDDGWNQIQFNLSDFTRRAYGTNYIETLRVQIHANCRIRRVYFSDRLYSEDELPAEFKLYLPVQNKAKVNA